MLIECIGTPFVCRWPGGEVRLEPGKPINLSDERAKRLLDRAPGKVRMITPTIEAGAQITWTRVDMTVQAGIVDLIHVDDRGIRWAFVTIGQHWAVVNLKFVKGFEK